MSFLGDLFGGGSDPAKKAKPYLDQIPGVGHKYYDPFINQGRGASEHLGTEYGNNINDPTSLINKIMGNYKESEGYNFKKDALTRQMGATSAAGGVAGTPMDQQNQAAGVNGLLSEDMQQFLQNALGVYNGGIAGEQGIADKGFNASGSMTDLEGGALNQQAGLAFQGQQQKNSNQQALFSSLAKALGMGAGGGAFGGLGALGSLAGGGLGSSMYGGG